MHGFELASEIGLVYHAEQKPTLPLEFMLSLFPQLDATFLK